MRSEESLQRKIAIPERKKQPYSPILRVTLTRRELNVGRLLAHSRVSDQVWLYEALSHIQKTS